MNLNDILNEEYRLVSENLFSYLGPKYLAILGACSRQLRETTNSSNIWHKFCLNKGYEKFYFLIDLPNHESVPVQKSITASPIYLIPSNNIDTLEQLGYWREVYNRAEHLIKNWKMGIYSIAPILKGHKGKITAFDSDGITIASGSREAKEIKIWSIDKCECENTIKLKTDSINCLKIYKNEVIVGGEDGILRIYDMFEGDLNFTLTNKQTSASGGAILKLLLSQDLIFAVFNDYTIKAWCLFTYYLQFNLRGHTDDIECLFVDKNNDYLLSGSWDKQIIMYDLTNGSTLIDLTGHTEVVNCIKMKNNIIISCSSDETVRIWCLNTQTVQDGSSSKLKKTVNLNEDQPCIICKGHSSDVNVIETYDDYIASGSSDSNICVWNFAGDLLFKLTGHLGVIRSLYMDDYKLVSGGDAKRIMVWDYKNGNLLNILYRNPNKLNTMIVNETKIITESPEAGYNITIICYW